MPRPVFARILVCLGVIVAIAQAPAPARAAGTTFWAGPPNPGATKQIKDLKRKGKTGEARRLQEMANVPGSVWLTDGTPADVEAATADTIAAAEHDGAVPVLVAYDIPQRDCGLYSSGGAADGQAYRAWIDGMAAGLGQAQAVVVVEPDGLSGTPTDCGQTDKYGRLSLIKYAADHLATDLNASVYIDAGNGNWNPPATTAARLVEAGVQDVAGFALNVSNFQYTVNSDIYGTWVADCIAYGTQVDPGNFAACPDQYGSWNSHPLSPYGHWTSGASKSKFNVKPENDRYSALLNGTPATTHFVVDTSRNGLGPWPGTSHHPASQSNTEAWCNPPNRGAGQRPTSVTSYALADAYLWVKIPGESDGQCYRWTNGPNDPARHGRDPDAGGWFRAQALEFANLAVPAFP